MSVIASLKLYNIYLQYQQKSYHLITTCMIALNSQFQDSLQSSHFFKTIFDNRNTIVGMYEWCTTKEYIKHRHIVVNCGIDYQNLINCFVMTRGINRPTAAEIHWQFICFAFHLDILSSLQYINAYHTTTKIMSHDKLIQFLKVLALSSIAPPSISSILGFDIVQRMLGRRQI